MLLCPWTVSTAQTRKTVADSADFVINFRQSKWKLNQAFGNNTAVLDSIEHLFTTIESDSIYRLRSVSFVGGASPEGPVWFNHFLSEQRAHSLFDYLNKRGHLSDDDVRQIRFVGRDWDGVLRLAESDDAVPYRQETLALLQTIVAEKHRSGGIEPPHSLERLKRLRGGVPYRYLYRNIFPIVRASRLVIGYDRFLPIILADRVGSDIITRVDSLIGVPPAIDAVVAFDHKEKILPPFYMDVRTNLIGDALLLPNIGVEFYLGKNYSLGLNWTYAWWSRDVEHRYWRAYGGELFGRWWFGKAAQRKPLTGHHLGIYAQVYTYDFEFGGEGEMGGKPGGTIFDRYNYGMGFEYGYSLPIANRLNLDFSIGLGFFGGKYHKYIPVDRCYVWQATKNRRYWGPTKVEVSLVWLIGRGNFNAKKGGNR